MMKNRSVVALAILAVLSASASRAAEEKAAAPVSVTGKWESVRETPAGTFTIVYDFKQDGETLTGTASGRERENPLTGTVKGNKIQFSYSAPGRDGEARTLQVTGTVDGDTIKGESETPRGKREWTAKRTAAAKDEKK